MLDILYIWPKIGPVGLVGPTGQPTSVMSVSHDASEVGKPRVGPVGQPMSVSHDVSKSVSRASVRSVPSVRYNVT